MATDEVLPVELAHTEDGVVIVDDGDAPIVSAARAAIPALAKIPRDAICLSSKWWLPSQIK